MNNVSFMIFIGTILLGMMGLVGGAILYELWSGRKS